MADVSITAPAPATDERLAAVDPQVGRYSGAKDCHVVASWTREGTDSDS